MLSGIVQAAVDVAIDTIRSQVQHKIRQKLAAKVCAFRNVVRCCCLSNPNPPKVRGDLTEALERMCRKAETEARRIERPETNDNAVAANQGRVHVQIAKLCLSHRCPVLACACVL